MKRLLLPITLLFCISSTFGQLVVDPNYTAQQLVQNVLVGNGVQVTNVTFSYGDPVQIGYFDANNANLLNINEGVILSTGEAVGAEGPNDQQSISQYGGGLNCPGGEPDLLQASGLSCVNDEVVIEFDFVPQGDTIEFDYIFGSDEHTTYAPGSINDVFGFFISGPGINGPYQNNAENIATIPGTGQPVTLNTVNYVTNTAFYVDNGDDDTGTPPAPYSTDPAYIQYDGHTVTLTAKRAVQCGQTYHLKLAIADGSDDYISSGVFLKANSLSSDAITVDANVDFGQNDSTLWEGCGSAKFDLVRQGDSSQADTAWLQTSGSATEGTDYSNIPDTMFFSPGQDSLDVVIDAFSDNLSEGVENVVVDVIFKDPSSCSIWDTTSVEVFISDPDTLQLSTSPDTSYECGVPAPVWTSIDGGYGIYDVSWNTTIPNGDTSATVTPSSTTDYIVTVSDTCGVPPVSDTVTVTVPNYAPLDIHIYDDTTFVCPGQTIPVGFDSISGGSGNVVFSWDSLGTDTSYNVSMNSTTTFEVTAVDTCLMDSVTRSMTVTKGFGPMNVITNSDTNICLGTPVELEANSWGGTGDHTYNWDNGLGNGDQVVANPDSVRGTYTYVVTATDSCGVTAKDSILVKTQGPEAAFHFRSNITQTGSPIYFINDSRYANSYFWDFGDDEQTATSMDTVVIYESPEVYEVVLTAYDGLGCEDTAVKLIDVKPTFRFFVPNAFSPDGDGLNEEFGGTGPGIAEYRMEIYNRWGAMIYKTEKLEGTWDGTVNGDPAPNGVYIYKFILTSESGTTYEYTGHVNLIR